MSEKIISQGEAELRLKKAHVQLMRHPETYIWAGLFMLGESTIVDDFPTACTDGKNKMYGREFISGLSIEEFRGVILHENLHVGLRHIPRFRELMLKGDPYIGPAMDYAVNDIIHSMEDKSLCKLPEPHLYDQKYHGWAVMEIRDDLMKQYPPPPSGGGKAPSNDGKGNKKGKGTGIDGLKTLDDHDPQAGEAMTPQEAKQLEQQVKEALEQGALLAGRMRGGIPRSMREALAPEVNWREEVQEFVTSSCRGMDEMTWREFNRRRLADDYYQPTSISETITEVTVAIDTSGSIGQEDLAIVGSHLANVCEAVKPDRVRVLWWDTEVHGEQVFEGSYDNLKDMLKPMGGGGTCVSSVSAYAIKNRLSSDCLIVFSDGYVESGIKWETDIPTLWLIRGNTSFQPPAGRLVAVNSF